MPVSFAYLPFMLIGMIADTLYQGTIVGVVDLVEERENDFTAEFSSLRYRAMRSCWAS